MLRCEPRTLQAGMRQLLAGSTLVVGKWSLGSSCRALQQSCWDEAKSVTFPQPPTIIRASPSPLQENAASMNLASSPYRYALFISHVGLSSSLSLLQPCRRFSAHVEYSHAESANKEPTAGYLLSEKCLTDINEALAEVGSENRAKLPPEIVLHNFFEHARSIAQVVDLLRKGVWDEEVQRALRSLGLTFNTVLATQVLRADIPCDVAVGFFQWLKRVRRFKHNEYTYGVMLNTLGRAGRLHEMQQLFDEMKANACVVTPVTLSNVMLWYFRAKDMRGVASHWRTLRRSGTKPSSAIYAAYIDFLVRAKRYTKVAVIFEEMLRVDCLPSSRTYTVFIQHLVEIGNVEAAAKILQAMQTVRLVPSRVTYKTVINGFAKVGNVETVLELLGEMKEHFHRPTKQLMPAVRALQDAGKSEEATTLLEEISPEFVSSTSDMMESSDDDDACDSDCSLTEWRAVPCLHVGFDVNAFAQALHTWDPEVEEVLEHANMHWESSLVTEVLKRVRNVDSLWPFFHWLKDKAGFKHDSYSCVVLVQRILKSKLGLGKKASMVRQLFEGLQSDGIKFTVPMFNLVMRHYVAAGEGERALDMFKLMKQFELDPNGVSYALVIQGCAKNRQVEKVTKLLEEMDGKGFQLNSSTRAELITCLGSVGKLVPAYELFCSVSASGRSPSSVEYKAIMAAYARVGDNAMSLQLYDEMREAGIAPTQDMYEVVTKVLQQANRLSEVRALAEERGLLNFFDGNKKVLQEKLLQILFLFMESIKPRRSQKSLRSAWS